MLNFPTDAITTFDRNETGTDHLGTLLLDNTDGHTRTILAVASQSRDARENTLYCGTRTTGTAFFDTMQSATTQFQRFMQFKCTLPIYSDTMRTSFVGMTYVDRDVFSTNSDDLGAVVEKVNTLPLGATYGNVVVVDQGGNNVYTYGGISYEGTIYLYALFLMAVFYTINKIIQILYASR